MPCATGPDVTWTPFAGAQTSHRCEAGDAALVLLDGENELTANVLLFSARVLPKINSNGVSSYLQGAS